MNKKILAIIPARAGSKRIKNKNKRLFCGRPLIQWTIEEALKSKFITTVAVTTDDLDILAYKSDFPQAHFFERPAELAQDETPGVVPVIDVMSRVTGEYDYILLLQPTSPLRSYHHIDAAIGQILNKQAAYLVSVRPFSEKPGHVLYVDGSSRVQYLSNLSKDPHFYVLNGAIYLAKWNEFLNSQAFIHPQTEIFQMSLSDSVDIDTEVDWENAQAQFKIKLD